MGEQIDRLFDTVNWSSDAFLDAIRFGNERACRFSKMVIEEAARTQREQAELTKQWMEAPVDAIGLTKASMEMWTRRQRRRVELTRTVFDEVAGVRDETRDVVGRVAGANREAVGIGIDAGRDAAAHATREVGERVEELSETLDKPAEAVDKAPRSVRRRNGAK